MLRRRVPRYFRATVVSLVTVLSPSSAFAEDEVSAEMLFARALDFKDAGECGEALPLFIASHRLAPSVGSLLNIADCERAEGRSATAWHRFQQAASLAASLGDEKRAVFARQRADDLEGEISRVEVVLVEPVPGITVSVDGKRWTSEQWNGNPTDPGEHQVVVRAPDYRPYERSLSVGPIERVTWTIPALVPFDQPPLPAAPPEVDDAQWFFGWAVIGVGGASLLTSAGLGIGALTHDNAIGDYCPDGDACLPEAADLQQTALDLERAAIATVTAGASLIAVGVVLLATADAPGEDVELSVGLSGVAIRGHF